MKSLKVFILGVLIPIEQEKVFFREGEVFHCTVQVPGSHRRRRLHIWQRAGEAEPRRTGGRWLSELPVPPRTLPGTELQWSQ